MNTSIHLLNLPYECLQYIFSFVSIESVCKLQLVSKSIFLSSQDNLIWIRFCVDHLKKLREKRNVNAFKKNIFSMFSSSLTKGSVPSSQSNSPLSFSPNTLLIRKEIDNDRYWKSEYKCYTDKPEVVTFQTLSGVLCVRHLKANNSDSHHFKVASGEEDGTIHIWDTEAPAKDTILGKHTDRVLCLAGGGNGWNFAKISDSELDLDSDSDFPNSNSNSDVLFSGSHDKTIKMWDLNTGSLVRTFSGHSGAVVCCVENGQHTIATGSGDRSVRIWDTRSPSQVSQLSSKFSSSSISTSPTKNSSYMSSHQLCKISGHEGTVLSLAVIDPEGRYLLSSARDNTIRLWDVRTCAQMQLHHTAGPVRDMSYIKYGTSLVTGGGYTNIPKLYLYNVNLEDKLNPVPNYKNLVKMLDPPVTMLGHGDAICSLTGDSTKVISASFDGSIKIWCKVFNGECVRTVGGHLREVTSVHLNRKSNSFVSGSLDCTIKVWHWDHSSTL